MLNSSAFSLLTCNIYAIFRIKRDILPVVLALCQDVEFEVRACMSRLLEPVARGLG